MPAMASWLPLIAALAATPPPPIASLRVDSEPSSFEVTVSPEPSSGYEIHFRCVATCTAAPAYREPVRDTPLGLFVRDDGLLYSLWSSGSGYRVRVWQIAGRSIGKVAELSSRGRPDFLSDKSGASAIRTYEGDSGVRRWRPVLWTFRGGRFVR